MPSLHERLSTGLASTCKVCAFLATLGPTEAAEWQTELALPVTVVGNTAVVNELARLKVDASEPGVRRHRSRHVRR